MSPATRSRRTQPRRDAHRRHAHPRSRRGGEGGSVPEPSPPGSEACEEATEEVESEAWRPTSYTALKLLLSARLCAAMWSLVADCDETYNYWEPMHYLLYGRGFQTWEYAPQYALRSYTYILVHAVPGKLYAMLLQSNRMLVFFFIRCLLALACSGCELYFYRGVCIGFSPRIGTLTIAFMMLSAGMFTASTALLPSSFAMYMALLSLGAWYQDRPPLAIFTTAVAAILGWPFAAALGVPIALDILIRRRRVTTFVKWCIISLVTVMLPMVQIDTQYYGRLVVAPLNIVYYNVFSVGPELYGTEPWTYYFLNGFLNFNFVFVAALLLPAVMCLHYFLEKQTTPGRHKQTSLLLPSPRPSPSSSPPPWLAVSPLYVWLSVFLPQPHKEERFLFPIYPLLPLAAALALDYGQKTWRLLVRFMYTRGKRTQPHAHESRTHWLALSVFVCVTSLLSLSRIIGQYRAYHAPMETYMELSRVASEEGLSPEAPVNLCVGKEWHRFPSSFFLPGLNWQLKFLQSEFRGQLPQYYQETGNGTATEPANMNNMNKEELTRYVNLSSCHFIIDLDDPSAVTPRQPSYTTHPDWQVVHTAPFLDAKRSSRFLRAFYAPWLTNTHCAYNNYVLLRRRSHKGGGGARGR